MSLLFPAIKENREVIAKKVYEKHFQLDPMLYGELDLRRKQLMYEDVLYNMTFLDAAMAFNDKKLFTEYAIWIYQLLCNLMTDLTRERIKNQMVLHYQIMDDVLKEILSPDEGEKAALFLRQAIEATEKEAVQFSSSSHGLIEPYLDLKSEYMDYLMKNDTKGALSLIYQGVKSGIELEDIYVKVLQEVMYEVGYLWHQNKISVDKEHYFTSVTQMVLAQFYPIIFNRPRNGFKLLACCVGSELHEMGIRMLSDLFDYHGWDSIYLGAAVPKTGVLNAVEEHKPHLVALSVTMPQHLSLCYDIVNAVRQKYPKVKIAVGGRAFHMTDELWRKWDVDVSTENALQMIEWANEQIIKI